MSEEPERIERFRPVDLDSIDDSELLIWQETAKEMAGYLEREQQERQAREASLPSAEIGPLLQAYRGIGAYCRLSIQAREKRRSGAIQEAERLEQEMAEIREALPKFARW